MTPTEKHWKEWSEMKFSVDKKTWTVTVKCKNKAEAELFFEYFKLGTEAYVQKVKKEAGLE